MNNIQAKGYTGFPEWLPAAKRVENEILETIKSVYESYGYTPIETSAVEKIEHLTSSTGDVSKEIYGIHRLAGESSEKFGLHFDQTLPLARYTANNANNLHFPFKRYQIQKVWRGERPQAGRFREFYQADIDIVGDETLALHYEAEVIEVIYNLFSKLNIGKFKIKVNNRKLLEGLYKSQGIENLNEVLIIIDKIDKIGAEKVIELLKETGLNNEQAEFCTEIASKKFTKNDSFDYLNSIEDTNEMLIQAKLELTSIFKNLEHLPDDCIIFDLSIARGLDYYTGSVYECELEGLEKFGSVCSGGRYDNLAEKFTKRKLPGVGLSIGVTRLLYLLFKNEIIKESENTPTKALVIIFDEAQRPSCNKIAADLRSNGIPTEVSPDVKKFPKQIKFAERRGASFIIIPEQNGDVNMKNIKTGDQEPLNYEKITSFLNT